MIVFFFALRPSRDFVCFSRLFGHFFPLGIQRQPKLRRYFLPSKTPQLPTFLVLVFGSLGLVSYLLMWLVAPVLLELFVIYMYWFGWFGWLVWSGGLVVSSSFHCLTQ